MMGEFQGNVAVFAYDIVGFTDFSQASQCDSKALTDRVLEIAKQVAKLTADEVDYQDAGDGGFLVIRTDARKVLEVLNAFVCGMEGENRRLQEQYRVCNRYALHYDTINIKGEGRSRRFLGDAINNCARLLNGMSKYYQEQAVCSGAYRCHVLTFGGVDERLFTRLHDIVDKHGKYHEVWNLLKVPGYGIPVADKDLYVPPR